MDYIKASQAPQYQLQELASWGRARATEEISQLIDRQSHPMHRPNS